MMAKLGHGGLFFVFCSRQLLLDRLEQAERIRLPALLPFYALWLCCAVQNELALVIRVASPGDAAGVCVM